MPGSLGKAHLLGDYFNHPNILAAELFINDGQILSNGSTNVLNGLRFCRSLRPASRQPRNGGGEALVRSMQCNFVFHGSKYSSSFLRMLIVHMAETMKW